MGLRIGTSAGLLALAFATHSAHADKPGAPALELSWNAIDECPSRDAVEESVRRILTGVPTRHAIVHAEVTRLAPRRWSVRLATNVDGIAGERSLEADSCAALASATILILAWTLDPLHAGAAAATVPPPPPPPPSPPMLPLTASEPSTLAPPERLPVPLRARPIDFGSRISSARPIALIATTFAGNVGTMPQADGGFELALGLRFGHLRAELAGSDWLAVKASSPLGGATLHMLDVAVRGCFGVELPGDIGLAPCLGLAADYALSAGSGESTTFPQASASWFETRGELILTRQLVGPLSLRGRLGVAVPFDHPSFVIVEPSPAPALSLHRVGVLSGLLGLGVEAHFP